MYLYVLKLIITTVGNYTNNNLRTIDRSTSRYVFFIDIERHRDDRLASVISDELEEQVKHDKSFNTHLNQENATLLRKPKVFHPKRKYDRHTTSQGI